VGIAYTVRVVFVVRVAVVMVVSPVQRRVVASLCE